MLQVGARIEALIILAALAQLGISARTLACAPAPPEGRHVEILEEEAIVVWDEERRVEHFIRRGVFDSDAPDFGFLVPAPAQPELAEAQDSAFARLAELTQPERIRKSVIVPMACVALPLMLTLSAPDTEQAPRHPAVQVLDAQRVAGYDAVVLRAADAGALNRWLGDHGYASRPDLEQWLEPYVRAEWTLTAFRIAAPEAAPIAPTAVRMSFSTDRPFFPYSEPAEQRTGPAPRRLLRIYFVGPWRVEGHLGAQGQQWPGQTVYAEDRSGVLDGVLPLLVPRDRRPAPVWLTEMLDQSSPRPGTEDLFFRPASSQTAVEPPPIVDEDLIPIPVDLILLGAVIAALMWRRARRRRTRTGSPVQAPGERRERT
jgi:hypothetical protein